MIGEVDIFSHDFPTYFPMIFPFMGVSTNGGSPSYHPNFKLGVSIETIDFWVQHDFPMVLAFFVRISQPRWMTPPEGCRLTQVCAGADAALRSDLDDLATSPGVRGS